jgi:hypothetical protein
MSGDWHEVAPSLRGLQWFITKPPGYLAEPQSHGAFDMRHGAFGNFEAEDTQHDRKLCVVVTRICDGCAYV